MNRESEEHLKRWRRKKYMEVKMYSKYNIYIYIYIAVYIAVYIYPEFYTLLHKDGLTLGTQYAFSVRYLQTRSQHDIRILFSDEDAGYGTWN